MEAFCCLTVKNLLENDKPTGMVDLSKDGDNELSKKKDAFDG